jgi:hypothetical protein
VPNRLRAIPPSRAAERAYLRVLRLAYDRETKLPADLVADLARETSLSQAAWVDARGRNDFPAFAPHLERMVELKKRQAACLSEGKASAAGGGPASAYDALLDYFEPGARRGVDNRGLLQLRKDLVALLDKIKSRPQVDDSFLHRPCPSERQAAISEWLMGLMSYDLSRGRLDTVAHPFTTTLGADDVRITTRYIEDFFVSSLFSTDPRGGTRVVRARHRSRGGVRAHAPARGRLDGRARVAVAACGRTWSAARSPFGRATTPASPSSRADALEGVGLEAFVRAINKVEPSFIRTEADEVTYGLHIILRFELESDLISGRPRREGPARGLEREDEGAPRRRAARRRARLPAGRALVGGPLRLLPELRPRQSLRGPVLVGDEEGDARPRRRGSSRATSAPSSPGCARISTSREPTFCPAELVERVTGEELDPKCISSPISTRSTLECMESSADPFLWAALASLFLGLALGQGLRALVGIGRGGVKARRLRSRRIARAIACVSLGILALTALFVFADKAALAEAASAAQALTLLAWASLALVFGFCIGFRPLVLGLPFALVLFAALGSLRLALEGWLPLHASASAGEIARLLPFEATGASFRGQLELPERDSVPVAQEVSLASGSVSLRAEIVELRGPLRSAYRLARLKARAAASTGDQTNERFYRVVGIAAPGAGGTASAFADAALRHRSPRRAPAPSRGPESLAAGRLRKAGVFGPSAASPRGLRQHERFSALSSRSSRFPSASAPTAPPYPRND